MSSCVELRHQVLPMSSCISLCLQVSPEVIAYHMTSSSTLCHPSIQPDVITFRNFIVCLLQSSHESIKSELSSNNETESSAIKTALLWRNNKIKTITTGTVLYKYSRFAPISSSASRLSHRKRFSCFRFRFRRSPCPRRRLAPLLE